MLLSNEGYDYIPPSLISLINTQIHTSTRLLCNFVYNVRQDAEVGHKVHAFSVRGDCGQFRPVDAATDPNGNNFDVGIMDLICYGGCTGRVG